MPNTPPIQGADTLEQGRIRINEHFGAIDPHDQYLTNVEGDARYVNEVDHTKAAHDALLINADTLDGVDSTGFTPIAHTTAADPHTQYHNDARGDVRYTPIAHTTAADPHTQYHTDARGDARYDVRYRRASITDGRDANVVTAIAATDTRTQRFTVALTADRTIALPTTGLFAGLGFRINRTDTAAFTLTIGTVRTIPSGTREWLDVEYTGAAWVLTARGVL